MITEVEEDEVLKKVIVDIQRDPNDHSTYTLEQGRLHYKGRLVLFVKTGWIPKLLIEFHSTNMGFTQEFIGHIVRYLSL